MKVNHLISDILRGPWLVNPEAVSQYEQLANNYLTGKFKGASINRTEILAAANSYTVGSGKSSEPEKRIVKIPMRGILAAYGDDCMLGADDYLQIFRAYNNNDSVAAVILDIDGPGSSVSAINMMKEFASEKKKPFIGLLNTAYSGHYWSGCLICDHLMAYGNISSGFGSIGVLSMVVDNRKAMEKEGYSVMMIRAPQSTTKAQQGKDFYEGKDEEFRASLEEEMRPMADAFIKDIKALRPKLDHSAPGVFTGSTFNAKDALKYGLIDSIGDEKKAIERAKILIELYEN
ncbi:S49 family peptidase [Chryseobacterium sp. FH1]|uniref:S49 family peptidase n=1 Tax=Chryseobacterium sp. FH1 TaxID=1233951 RepID=UPI0004E448DC|nr:S49 family peptidase [Chryseobacterium sp. FH1]KFC19366.1 hypothetical protein IO90_08665 [Chryseobacterium sp. FH1]